MHPRVEEISQERGWRSLSRSQVFYLKLRTWIHPLGFHHRVRLFEYVEDMDRMIDHGQICRVCGR